MGMSFIMHSEILLYLELSHMLYVIQLNIPLSLEIFYHNDPKFSDRLIWANSADPDQTAPSGAV